MQSTLVCPDNDNILPENSALDSLGLLVYFRYSIYIQVVLPWSLVIVILLACTFVVGCAISNCLQLFFFFYVSSFLDAAKWPKAPKSH
jgi:hypothetical protein